MFVLGNYGSGSKKILYLNNPTSKRKKQYIYIYMIDQKLWFLGVSLFDP